MTELTPEEEQKAIQGAPRGTFAILVVFAALMAAAWAFMFFYVFLEHGPVK
jgi:hypothetical protein